MRKLHTGLFGYARGEEVKLPRAITFCASLYSIGFPPELIGLGELTDKDYEIVCEVFGDINLQMSEAMKFFNPNSLKIIGKVFERDYMWKVVEAGMIRGFLG
ncbi:phosphoenolpyruvate carboxylase [Archaeoglobus neptunius]|uniref:phosphoenolpyruvate carboxylase n=1 Tax=Archaeoglobus neptunius TaxID=2798580 RepID=UPI00192637E7